MSVPAKESFFVKNATGIALVALTLLTVLASLLFLAQARTRDEAAQWVTHTYEVIGHLEQLSGNVKEMVIGQRGYMLTGDQKLLQPYYRALKDGPNYDAGPRTLQQQHSIAQQIAILKRLTADNPIQQGNLSELEESLKNLQAYLADTIERRRQSADMSHIIDTNLSKQYMDEIRNVVRVIETEESNLLALRREKEAVTGVVTMRMTMGSIFLFYLLLSVAVWMYQRNRARSVAEAARYTTELEKREEELKMQQEELKASNEEIEASNEELEEKSNALEEQNARIRRQSQDLEDAKQLIEEKAQELETASRYKSEFLANMSHELRTPLNSLLILARSFASNEEGNLTQEQVEEAKVIHNGGLELLNLINDILDLSKVEAGKLTIMAEDVLVQDIAGRMKSQFDPIARDRDVTLQVRMDPNLPEFINTDAQRVEQILKNLLSNAFKFTEKGSVTLDIHYPDSGVELQRASLVGRRAIAFAVTDTGIGIDESKFKDIFEAFQQEDGSTERHYGGTGLGLTIARKFAHMLGGEIHVSSTKGKGSTFTLFLPQETPKDGTTENGRHINTRAVNAPSPLPKAVETTEGVFVADDRNGITMQDRVVLIIEDDRDFATILMKIAHQRGYKG
ncbi:MAG TPA: CHASE3 domain-containing protein, partial [Alphaproteobacteria bacterium]